MLELKIPPVVVVILTAVLMWLMARAMPGYGFVIPGDWLLAQIVAAAGVVVAAWGVAAFRRAGTTVNPMKPESSSRLVVTGIYAMTRNPMYLGALLVLLAWAFSLAHPAAFLFLPLFVLYMNRFQIKPEERTLASRFGQTFTVRLPRAAMDLRSLRQLSRHSPPHAFPPWSHWGKISPIPGPGQFVWGAEQCFN